METLAVNVVGAIRRERWRGRDYLVAPVSMIVPGVLSGSKGPLLYPEDEVSKNPGAWNGMPIVVGHPVINGVHVSARSPKVLEKFGIGEVFSARYDGRLVAEGWFDERATKEKAPKTWAKLNARKASELSTGLFTDDEMAENGSVHPPTGKPYTYVARNYRPDHLAVLEDSKGACSVDDGCGVLVNADQTIPDQTTTNDGLRRSADRTTIRKLVDLAWNIFQPHSSDTGRFKKPNAGTGKSEFRDPALLGTITLSPDDRAHGKSAYEELKQTGHNPASWVADEDLWEKAKAAADKGDYEGETYWAVVTKVYKNMGGAMKDTTDNAFCPTGEGGGIDPSCPSGGSGGEGGDGGGAPTRPTAAQTQEQASEYGSTKAKLYRIPVDAINVKEQFGEDGLFEGEHVDSLKKAYEKGKPLPPIVIDNDGMIMDGMHRYSAAVAAGYKEIWAIKYEEMTENAFCPTGEGGGIDPSCSPGGGSGRSEKDPRMQAAVAGDKVKYSSAEVSKAKEGVHHVQFDPVGGKALRTVEVERISDGRAVVKMAGGRRTRLNHVATLKLIHGEYRSKTPTDNTKTDPDPGDDAMKTKAEKVQFLTANCSCWKGQEKTLNSMDEPQIDRLVKNRRDQEETASAVASIRKDLSIPEDITVNAMPSFIKKKIEAKDDADGDGEECPECGGKMVNGSCTECDYKANNRTTKPQDSGKGGTVLRTPTTNKADILKVLGELTENEVLSLPGMAGLRERDLLSQQILTNQKTQIVEQLTANISDPAKKKARQAHLAKLSLNELTDRLQDLPPSATPRQLTSPTIYLGAGGGSNPSPVGNSADDEYKPKPMPRITINWDEEKAALDARNGGRKQKAN